MVTTHCGSQLPRYPNMKPMAAALALLQLSSITQAQEAAQAAAPQLEQVVVSANRRIEKLEDVPQSISVLTGETLERNNCLLYTSPSPRDRTRSRMPSSA